MNRVASLRSGVTSNQVFGVFVFIFVELMFFSALFSSYYVIKRGRVSWDMPASVELPRLAAAFNIFVLLLSGVFLYMAIRALKKGGAISQAKTQILRAFLLGVAFSGFQIHLLLKVRSMGLTMGSSLFGACFNLMIGTHLVHVIVGTLILGRFYLFKSIRTESLKALILYWSFLVMVWPLLYAQLYS